jgi:hypothetical protein
MHIGPEHSIFFPVYPVELCTTSSFYLIYCPSPLLCRHPFTSGHHSGRHTSVVACSPQLLPYYCTMRQHTQSFPHCFPVVRLPTGHHDGLAHQIQIREEMEEQLWTSAPREPTTIRTATRSLVKRNMSPRAAGGQGSFLFVFSVVVMGIVVLLF